MATRHKVALAVAAIGAAGTIIAAALGLFKGGEGGCRIDHRPAQDGSVTATSSCR